MSSEQLFSTSLDSIADPFGVFTAIRDSSGAITDFRIDYINLAGAAMHAGAGSRDSQINQKLLSIAPFISKSGLFTQYVKLVESGHPIDGVFRCEHPELAAQHLEIRASKLGDGFVCIWRNMQGQAQLQRGALDTEERLRDLNDTLEKRVTERTAETQARAQQLRDLALALADAEARERKRLAQILHDHFQQNLSAAKLKAGILRRMATDQRFKDGAEQVERLLEQAMAESRRLTVELNPPVLYDAGLNAAVELFVRDFEQQHKLRVDIRLDPQSEPALEQVRVLLFEAIREVLNNVAQHAHATTVSLTSSLTLSGQIEIVATDDGQGFDVNILRRQAGKVGPLGLFEIRERLNFIGGDLDITSQEGKGTRVRLLVPAEFAGSEAGGS